MQPGDHGDGYHEHQERQHADIEAARDGKACGFQCTGTHLLRVGAVDFQQTVLDDDGEPEGHQQRRQYVVAKGLVQNAALKHIADPGHDGHDDNKGKQRGKTEGGRDCQTEKGGQHDEVAMGNVDQAHDTENKRQSGGEERIKPTEQNALKDGIDPVHLKLRNRQR